MTTTTPKGPEVLPVIQSDQERARDLMEALRRIVHISHGLVGDHVRHEITEAFARHRIDHAVASPNTEAMRGDVVEALIERISPVVLGRERADEDSRAYVERIAIAALSTLPATMGDGVDLANRKAVNTILAEMFGHLVPDIVERVRIGNIACTKILAALPATMNGGEAEKVANALGEILRCHDKAIEAHGKPRATLNGYGLTDMFDCLNHPFGHGEHKQKPYRSNDLEVQITDARAALAAYRGEGK